MRINLRSFKLKTYFIKYIRILLVLLLSVLILNTKVDAKVLKGGGATFPASFYQECITAYNQTHQSKIYYQKMGSAKGFMAFKDQALDFVGIDMFLNDNHLKMYAGELLHIPTCLSAIVLTYHLPGHPIINLTSDLISAIYRGEILFWDDDKIAEHNPDIYLPHLRIIPIYRQDGSGSTYIFSEFLTKTNQTWKNSMGVNGLLNFSVGMGAESSNDMIDLLTQLPGSIAYIGRNYAIDASFPMAAILNKSGRYVFPTLKNISLAADCELPADGRVFCTDTDNKLGYPLASFSWIVIPKNTKNENHTLLKNFITWLITDGQEIANSIGYAKLPKQASDCGLNQLIEY